MKVCFANTCEAKVKAHSKFCPKHHRDVEAIRYQAKQKKDKQIEEAVELAFNDPYKAQLALDDFDRENPSGKYRKKLIDFSAFKQKHGKRMEARVREEEEEMDITDFITDQKKRGVSDEVAQAKWKKLLESGLDKTGEGVDTKIWIPQNRKRFRDNIHYKASELEETSRAERDMSVQDRPGYCWCLTDRLLQRALSPPSHLSSLWFGLSSLPPRT